MGLKLKKLVKPIAATLGGVGGYLAADKLVGGGGGGAPGAIKDSFDITKQAEVAQGQNQAVLDRSKALSEALAGNRMAALTQMGAAAAGQGPSLAQAQLKAAQDRNLAQQLASMKSMRGNAGMNARLLTQNMGASGRDLAQQAAISRLQERDAFINQANQAEQSLRGDIQNQFNYAIAPNQSLQEYEKLRLGADQANYAARKQMQGAIIGGIAQVGAGFAKGGMNQGGYVQKVSSTNAALPYYGSSGGNFLTGKDGMIVPGEAQVEGDHEANDTVHTILSPGELVVPRSVVSKGSDAVKKFAEALLAAEEAKKGSPKQAGEAKGFAAVLQSRPKSKK